MFNGSSFRKYLVISLSIFFVLLSVIGTQFTQASVTTSSANTTDTATFGVAEAAYTESNYPNTATGGQQNYYLGQDFLNGQYNKGLTRLYIKFGFGTGSLPPGAIITNATVYLYQYSRSCALNSTFSYSTYPVTSNWAGNSITWNNSPGLGGSIGGGSFACASSQWKTFDITSLAQSWLAGGANYGVSFWGNPESAAGVVFRSHTCNTSQCPGQEHPYLLVNYSIPAPPTPTNTPPPTIPPTITPTRPPQVCNVPYFSQRDPRWKNHPLRTNGACSVSCNTIGACGCTLTSGAMIFKHFEANLTPASLSDCMGTSACPFYWGVGAACSQGQAQFVAKYGFTWNRLQTELNQYHRPVILGMHKGNNTHWVVVISGSGTNPANYVIHDPWPVNGANMHLNSYSAWSFDSIAVYAGDTACQHLAGEVVENMGKEAVAISSLKDNWAGSQSVITTDEALNLRASGTVTGTVDLYRMTAVTMTLQLSASESATEMLIWTDETTQASWQPLAEFVYLPVGETIYARFRDGAGNMSDLDSDTRYPVSSPPIELHHIYLPVVVRP